MWLALGSCVLRPGPCSGPARTVLSLSSAVYSLLMPTATGGCAEGHAVSVTLGSK